MNASREPTHDTIPQIGEWEQTRRYELSHKLACLDPPDPDLVPLVDGPETLLQALVLFADSQGRYYGDISLLAHIMYHPSRPEDYKADQLSLYQWRDELLRQGDITILPLADNCYGGTHLVLTLRNRWRFDRWRNRNVIPKKLREAVYGRDGHKCVTCGATERLTLDHITPWSRGGEDSYANLQTMCQPCNSRKGNRMEVV